MKEYDHKKLEKKWQAAWAEKKAYKAANNSKKKKYYVLDMFPYPSGTGLHVGHPKGYIGSDVFARMKRMQGFNVLHPMGYDSFGLPAEQYAIEHNINPAQAVEENVKTFEKQLSVIGLSYDWGRRVKTSDPDFYKFTQWIFLQIYNSWYNRDKDKAEPIEKLIKIFEKSGNAAVNAVTNETEVFSAQGWKAKTKKEKQDALMKYRLAYEGTAQVNWCPKLGTVLANDEVVDGKDGPVSERGGYPVVKKDMRQWFMRITAYAEKLLSGLEGLDWSTHIKEIQKNWIGKSEGAEIEFKIRKDNPSLALPEGEGEMPRYFTTDPKLWHVLQDKALEMRKNPTDGEKIIWDLLRRDGTEYHFRRQHIIDRFIVDFVCLEKRLVIEIDGDIHDSRKEEDAERTAILRKNGFEVLRFSNDQVNANKENVLKEIILRLKTFSRPPLSFGEGRGGVDLGMAKVFTTRADTLYGATYVVLAPEHELVKKLKPQMTNWDKVLQYIVATKAKNDRDPESLGKEKTGVELAGVKAINPATGEEIPVWIADYVLSGYGTGAVMGVPGHDERDNEFAKKYGLPIVQVIEPLFINAPDPGLSFVERNAVSVIVKHWSEDKYLALKWKKVAWGTFVTGGVEHGQAPEEAARREIEEETGYSNIKSAKILGRSHSKFYHAPKKENRFAHFTNFYFELKDGQQKEISAEEKEKHELVWLKPEEVEKFLTPVGQILDWKILRGENGAYGGAGVMINSGRFDGMDSEKAKKEITNFAGGKIVTNYKMRDAIFARQRYWGEPIPLMYDKNGIIKELPEKSLPLKLPPVKSYQPTGTGESPLASVPAWAKKGYETNTMPGWAGSSWYFLRYMDPKNKKVFADKKAIEYWKNVDMYVGGQEHATGHLLYSRFWHKFLKDYGLVVTDEPFQTLRNQGMILGADNRKMSKRWGNVINPDEVVKNYGADTLRVYEMFMGPFGASLPWSTDNIVGSRRFLERVWKFGGRVLKQKNSSGLTLPGVPGGTHTVQNSSVSKLLHKTIKKVTEDIETFSFNTAVSTMMILMNEMEKEESLAPEDFELFLKILSPFAPHMTEEIWSLLGHKTLLVLEVWPKADPEMMKESEIKIVVQTNGKVRTEMMVGVDESEEDIRKKALADEAVMKHLAGKEIKRVIYVKNRLINIVV